MLRICVQFLKDFIYFVTPENESKKVRAKLREGTRKVNSPEYPKKGVIFFQTLPKNCTSMLFSHYLGSMLPQCMAFCVSLCVSVSKKILGHF